MPPAIRALAGLARLGGTRAKARWHALDVVLAAALLMLALPRVWSTSPGELTVVWEPSVLAVALVVVQTVPIAVRRLAPLPVLIATVVGAVAYNGLAGQPEPDYFPALIAIYTVAANLPSRTSRWWCGAVALVLPFTIAEYPTVLGVARALVLIAVVWALGLERRRAVIDRAEAASERARQESREQALRAARDNLHRRERIARDLHDVLARTLTLVVVQAEALRVAAGGEWAARLERMRHSAGEALATVRQALTSLDQAAVPEQPTGWEELLSGFRDSGLVVEADPRLGEIPLGDDTGRCLHRVVHEGLTNVLRHAGLGSRVRISVEPGTTAAGRRQLTVRVSNEQTGDPPPYRAASSGFGLASLERDLAVLGGALTYGQTPEGWHLSARVPLAGAPRPRPAASGPIPVVVVDDQPMVREGLRILLDAQPGIDVVAEFPDGADLLGYLDATADAPGSEQPTLAGVANRYPGRPLVLLLDLVMPGVDGMAVLTTLAQRIDSDQVRVLVLTTYGGKDSVRRALALGASGYVLKDSTAEQLATAVRAVADGLTALSPRTDSAPTLAPTGARRPADSGPEALTPREAQVLTLLGDGLSNRVIAGRLGVSERTVKIHVSRILAKLGVESRTQAALRARDG